MPGFEFTTELQPFLPIAGDYEYRISGTFQSRNDEHPTIDCVEVPRHPRGWVTINKLTPFWPAYWEFINGPEGQRAIDAAIAAECAWDYQEAAE